MAIASSDGNYHEDMNAYLLHRYGAEPVIGDTSQQDSAPQYIVRHGSTELNEADKARGWSDIPLSKEGKEEAEKAAGELKGKVGVIVHSDLDRATQTAKMVAEGNPDAKLIANKNLRTWDIGEYEGKPCKEADKALKTYVEKTPDKPVPGGESFNNFKHRVMDGYHEALEAADGQPMAIVTHNKVERLLAGWEQNDMHPNRKIDLEEYHKEGPPPGSVRLAGDVVPGPWTKNIRELYPVQAGGRWGINTGQGLLRRNFDTSKVEHIDEYGRMGKMDYDKALQDQRTGQQIRDMQQRGLKPKPEADIIPFPERGYGGPLGSNLEPLN